MLYQMNVFDWLQRASRIFLIGTIFVSLGGHLTLLQTIAWGNMLKNFSRTASFTEAAKKTFDGDHPCALCKVVKESKNQDKQKILVKGASKMEVVLPAVIRLKTQTGVIVVFMIPSYFGIDSEIALCVPLQPPRSV